MQDIYWKLRDWQFRWIPLAKSDWIDSRGKLRKAKRPDGRNKKSWNWNGTKPGPIGGYTSLDLISAWKDETYAVVPSVPATGGFHGYAVIDIDNTPEYTKDDLKGMALPAAQNAVDGFIRRLMNQHPWMRAKLICRYRSGSGIGVHLWYRHHGPEMTAKGNPIGRRALPFGDLIINNYVALYDPAALLAGLQQDDIKNVTQDEFNALAKKIKAEPILPPKERVRTGHSYDMNVDGIFSDLGPQEGIGAARAMQMLLTIFESDDPQSDDPQYRWTPSDLARQLGKFSIEYWDDHRFWLLCGMALCYISNDRDTRGRMFRTWTEFSKLSHKYDEGHQKRAWASFQRQEGDRITMGSVTRLAKLQPGSKQYIKKDTGSVEKWISDNVTLGGEWITAAMAFEKYDGPEARKSFAKIFNKWCRDQGAVPVTRRGTRGWK